MNAELTTTKGKCEMCSTKAGEKLLIVFKGQMSGELCPDHFAQIVKMHEPKKD